jgi:hypothetical protein
VSDVASLGLLASAIAGRPLEVRALGPGQLAWTDGNTVFAGNNPVVEISAQASLLATGALARVTRPTRAFMATEAPRAMEANAAFVPAFVLAHARSEHVDVDRDFGTVHLRRIATETLDADRFALGRGGAVGKLLARLFTSERRDDAGEPGGDSPTHRGAGGEHGSTVAVRPGALDELRGTPTSDGIVYPEWNAHRREYRRDWCTVVESDAPATGDSARQPHTVAVRRALTRLGLGLTDVRHQRQGDDVDIDAAIASLVDVRAGGAAHTDTYVDNLRRRRDLSVLVLLDVSGSAGERGASGKTVHEHQTAAALALTSALSDLGDRVGLYAFNSKGRHAVQVARVKAFAEPCTAQTTRRLGGLTPGAYTRLGAAIRHGAHVLARDGGTPRQLLVVVSDGFAYDHGYDANYGEADAARALSEARRRGIGCVCLSVGADSDTDALRRVFGPAAHATMPGTERLAGVIAPLFRSAIDSVVAR